jgi:hypothetical protein
MSDETLWLAEITVYDPGIPGTTVLRYATGRGHVTGPAETPASTYYDARIAQPAAMSRTAFAAGATQGGSTLGYGDLVLINEDGALDGLLAYGFDGRPITIRRGSPGAAYPSGFPVWLTGTMQQPEVTTSTVTIKLRDRQAELTIPLQPTKYAGTNTPPTGLEGTATDLKGKPKPLLFGKVLNISPPLVNAAKLIYQLHDGAVASVQGVYDKGLALGINSGGHCYVAVGGGGKISTSPDGATWTAQTSGTGNNLNGVACGMGLLVAVGDSGTIITSPDSINWTTETGPFSGANVRGVAYGAGCFIAVANGGFIGRSVDGHSWALVTSPFGGTTPEGVVYRNGLFVATALSSKIGTSADGVSWSVASPIAKSWWSCTYGNSTFLIGGGNSGLATSADGSGWTDQSGGSPSASDWNGAAYGAGLFCVVGVRSGSTGAKIGTSPDGAAWTDRTPDAAGASYDLLCACYGGGLFVVGGDSGSFSGTKHIQTSPDGVTWTARTSQFGTGVCCLGVCYAENIQDPYFASLADLQDDTKAPAAGSWKVYLAGGYVRLGSSPAGTVTADATAGAAAADRTAAQLWKAVLTKAGKSAADWSASDITALDALNAAVCGVWIGAESTPAAELDGIAGSVGAWWGVDKAGIYRIQQLVAPGGAPVATITANDLQNRPERVATNDAGAGIPCYATIVRYGHNYTVQTSDLAGGVTTDRRARLAAEWLEAKAIDAAVQTVHLLAPQLDWDSLLAIESDAQAEATRRLTLRKVRRDPFVLVVPLDDTFAAVDLGNVVNFVHARYGLSAGKLFVVLGVAPDVANRAVTFWVWG